MRTPLVLLPLLALGVLAACGDDDDSASTTVAAVTSDPGDATGGSTAETLPDATATEDTTATDETATDETATGETTGGTVNPEYAEWCAKADEIGAATDVFSDDPAELEQQWPETMGLIDEIVELSPDEIADEVVLVQQFWQNTGDALEANGWDVTAISEEEVTPEGFDEAGESISAFEEANCGGLS